MIRKFEKNDIDAVMQIWKSENIKAHKFIPKEYWDSNYLLTWHYLSDGIMEICYRYSAGEFKVLIKYFIEDYQIDDYSEPVRERYDGHILEKDQIQ